MREQIAASRAADGWLWRCGGEAFDLVEDSDGDELCSRQRLLVGEAEDLDADGRQCGVALGIALEADFVAVLGAVDLDGELKARTEEVEGVRPCGRLAPELGAEVAVPEDEPDSGLGVGRGHALEAAEIDRG